MRPAVALAENATVNGVTFLFGHNVGDVLTEDGKVTGVITDHGIIKAPYVINAAGVYADDIAKMAGDQFYTIHGQKRYDCDYGQGESARPIRDWYLSSLPNIIKEKMWNQRVAVCIRPLI